ncbi:MAG: CPBP family intramembrane metalloprotease [Lachnospiraceae bacterium]|nr:CPBP family intramembrane metalloprotease [Lachnospiraceae bacterium]
MRFNEDKEPSYLGWLFFISIALHILASLAVSVMSQKGIELPVEASLVLSELTILVPTLIYILAGNLGFKSELGFRAIKPATFFMSLLLTAVVTPIATLFNIISQFFVSNTMVEMSDTLVSGSGIAVLLLGSVYGPVCEELTFRSVFARRYERYAGPMGAALISAALFALAHMNLNQAMYAFVLGWIFAVVNKAARSVYPSMIMHICINFGNLAMLLAASKAAEVIGATSLAESAESVRNSNVLYAMASVFLILAAICAAIAIPCIVFIAKHEGGLDGLLDMFRVKHEQKNWLRVSTVLGIVLVLVIMFGLGSFLKVAGQ